MSTETWEPTIVEEVGALRTRTHALAAEHDRLYRELERLGWVADRQRDEVRRLHEQVEEMRRFERAYWAVSTVKCWTNEDGKRFVFADDLAVALGVPGAEPAVVASAQEREETGA